MPTAPPPRSHHRLRTLLGQRSIRLALVMALLLGTLFASSAVYLARLQTIDEYRLIANNLAEYAALRTQRIREHTRDATATLEKNARQGPCSASNIALMQRLSYGNDFVVDMGYVENDQLLCSAIGRFAPGIPVGKSDAISASGATLRMQVALPFGQGERYLLASFAGFSAIMKATWSDDVQGWLPDSQVAIGMYHPVANAILFSHGPVRTDLLAPHGPRPRDARDYIVAQFPTDFGYSGFAIIPIQALQQRWRSKAAQAIPTGLVIGLLLAALVAWLTQRQTSLPAMIRHALHDHEFHMVYQPVVDLASGQWVGMEALMRWTRPNGHSIAPDIFIAAAEHSGQIRAVTQWMLRQVARETGHLLKAHPGRLHLAVNLASDDLSDAGFIEHWQALLDEYQLPATQLIGEITERVFMDAEQTGAQIHALRNLGVGIAIDDFGTGYSSLSYLAQMEMDYLKIDKIFVTPIGTGAVTANVVPHIISLAQSLNLKMVAEGVETPEQADWLRRHGVQLAQGWLFARPMPIQAFERQWLAQQQALQPVAPAPPPGAPSPP